MPEHDFSKGSKNSLPCIFSLSGLTLSEEERSFFKESNPFGFILFGRNIEEPKQLRALIADLKETVGRECPVLIDQEGGRVQRLRPPHWRDYNPMKYFGDLYGQDPEKALEELRFETLRLAEELVDVGFNVNCAPVLDLDINTENNGIGDRAFSDDPVVAGRLGLSVCRHFLKAGVTPIIKHIPGHGRANADSHHELPYVDESIMELFKQDFAPFRQISQSEVGGQVWAMTAHIVYESLDSEHPVSVSPEGIARAIREDIGFDGILICDDMDMKALDKYGSTSEKAVSSLKSGCDLALYCWADMAKMQNLAENLPKMSENTLKRLQNAVMLSDDAA